MTSTGTAGNPTLSLTTASSSDDMIDILSRYSTSTAIPNFIPIYYDNGTSTFMAGSYQKSYASGTFSDSYAGTTNNNWSMVMAAMRPAPNSGTSISTSTNTSYIFNDYLGGTNVVTDPSGVVTEAISYYPYGSTRVDATSGGGVSSQRKYIGQIFDPATQLSYLNARYYNGSQGGFISQDPLSLALGDPNHLQQNDQNTLLADPQSLNPYSYAKDNPITSSDPTGLTVILESIAVFGSNGNYAGAHTFFFVAPDHPNEINISGVPANSIAFTFSGEPSGSGFPGSGSSLTRQVNADLKNSSNYSKILNEKIIKAPNGESDTQFINNLGAQFNAMNLDGINYNFGGTEFREYNGNSNNFTYTLGVNSGIQDQIQNFNPTPSQNDPYGVPWAPGWGNVLPGQTAPNRYSFSGGKNIYGESYGSLFGNSNSNIRNSNSTIQ